MSDLTFVTDVTASHDVYGDLTMYAFMDALEAWQDAMTDRGLDSEAFVIVSIGNDGTGDCTVWYRPA